MSEQTPIARERLVFRPQFGPAGDVLVTVLLRGGMDGLYAVPPLADPDYARSASGVRRLGAESPRADAA